jgi:hypothetical protein
LPIFSLPLSPWNNRCSIDIWNKAMDPQDIETQLLTSREAKNGNVAARDGSQSQPSGGEGIYCRGRRFGAWLLIILCLNRNSCDILGVE